MTAVVVARFFFRVYQVVRGPRLPSCRYFPTCSEYALHAIETHGPRAGLRLALGRMLRCRPRGGWGVDPVPVVMPLSRGRSELL